MDCDSLNDAQTGSGTCVVIAMDKSIDIVAAIALFLYMSHANGARRGGKNCLDDEHDGSTHYRPRTSERADYRCQG